jgi:hypothetical protein
VKEPDAWRLISTPSGVYAFDNAATSDSSKVWSRLLLFAERASSVAGNAWFEF